MGSRLSPRPRDCPPRFAPELGTVSQIIDGTRISISIHVRARGAARTCSAGK